jgi:hypothetical protein
MAFSLSIENINTRKDVIRIRNSITHDTNKETKNFIRLTIISFGCLYRVER